MTVREAILGAIGEVETVLGGFEALADA